MSYACHNRADYAQATYTQDGWQHSAESRKPVMRWVPFAMTTGCQYQHTDLGKADQGCDGCSRRDAQ